MTSDGPEGKLRVVLDSNVLISGFAFPGGPPYQILQVLLRGEIEVVISPLILEEVQRILLEKLGANEETVGQALALLREHCIIVDPQTEAHVATLTAQDNRVLDCAIEGKARYLVTGDKGIQQVNEFQGIGILNPAQFLTLIR